MAGYAHTATCMEQKPLLLPVLTSSLPLEKPLAFLEKDTLTQDAYHRPTSGLMGYVPDVLVPYAELMRLHKPAGYYAFYFPHLFGLLYGAILVRPSPEDLFWSHMVIAAGCLFLRGAACTYNDTVDAPFDRQVARCRNRPIARGAVSTTGGLIFMILQSGVCLAFLAMLPRACLVPAALYTATMALYPLCKRFTNYPQVVLGFSFSLGQLVGAASVGLDVFNVTSSDEIAGMACLYLSNVANTVVYDTVYAHQDLKDDLKAGVMSMAVAVQGCAKPVLFLLATAEVVLLAIAGYCLQLTAGYFILGAYGTAVLLGYMLLSVRLDVPEDCWKWFKLSIYLSGMTLSGGLLSDYLLVLL